MIQLIKGNRALGLYPDLPDAAGARPFHPTRPADLAEAAQRQEADEPILFVSPPPPSWPRIFPPL